eukprot:6530360-Lingulodinium_polyedra.AAC.3
MKTLAELRATTHASNPSTYEYMPNSVDARLSQMPFASLRQLGTPVRACWTNSTCCGPTSQDGRDASTQWSLIQCDMHGDLVASGNGLKNAVIIAEHVNGTTFSE